MNRITKGSPLFFKKRVLKKEKGEKGK